MKAPRLEINIDKIEHNTRTLVERLSVLGISVTGVTKSVLGSVEIVKAMIRAGVSSLGDSRVENIQNMRVASIDTPINLIRSPMLSQVDYIVANTDLSFNTELEIIYALSIASLKIGRIHDIILMVELGDLREGIMPKDLEFIVSKTLEMPGVFLKGIGSNLACRNGVSPDHTNMTELSLLADSIEANLGIHLEIISGGNSANLNWAFGSDGPGRINNLRLGESLLLGCETLNRQAITGLHTDAICLVAEVIECKSKPSSPWGAIAENAQGQILIVNDRGEIWQVILSIGQQDMDSKGLIAPYGIDILDASSDHLLVESNKPLAIGSELSFQINYSALVRAMTSPFVTKKINYLSVEDD